MSVALKVVFTGIAVLAALGMGAYMSLQLQDKGDVFKYIASGTCGVIIALTLFGFYDDRKRE